MHAQRRRIGRGFVCDPRAVTIEGGDIPACEAVAGRIGGEHARAHRLDYAVARDGIERAGRIARAEETESDGRCGGSAARRDQARLVELLELRLDIAGRLHLRILVAAVRHDGDIESILSVIQRIIDVQARFLIRRQLGR